ncbi:MAG: hypothetical protein AAF363_07420 [Bacteroidota bacterium]
MEAKSYLSKALDGFRKGNSYLSYSLAVGAKAYLERFDSSEALDITFEANEIIAACALKSNSPIDAVTALKESAQLGENCDTKKDLLVRAIKQDKEFLTIIQESVPRLSDKEAANALQYLFRHPSGKRLEIAQSIIERLTEHKTYYKVAWLIQQNRLQEAKDMLSANHMDNDTLNQLEGFLSKPTIVTDLFLDDPFMADSLNLVDACNRGFTLFSNAIYQEALLNFKYAETINSDDPFVHFGLGLSAWLSGFFQTAEMYLFKTIDRINDCNKFRPLAFARADNSTPPRTEQYQNIYPIFNPSSCLRMVKHRTKYSRRLVIP